MKKEVVNEIFEWTKTIVFAVLLAVVILQFVRPTLVDGESMDSTLNNGDFLIINKNAYRFKEPKCGDIIVFKSNLPQDENTGNPISKLLTGDKGDKKNLVKRVIGVSGDNVKIQNEKVYVNGKELKETYLNKENTNNTDGNMDLVVPKGTVFVLGDNREISLDSRYSEVGFIKVSDILGKPFIRLYPFDKIKLLNNTN